MNRLITKSGFNGIPEAIMSYILGIGLSVLLLSAKYYVSGLIIICIVLLLTLFSLKKVSFYEDKIVVKRVFQTDIYSYSDFDSIFIAFARNTIPNLALCFKSGKMSLKFGFGKLKNLSLILDICKQNDIKIIDPSEYLKKRGLR